MPNGSRKLPFWQFSGFIIFLVDTMIDREIALEINIARSRQKLLEMKIPAKEIVQGICQWYFIQKGLKVLPDHISKTVNILDKFAYGREL